MNTAQEQNVNDKSIEMVLHRRNNLYKQIDMIISNTSISVTEYESIQDTIQGLKNEDILISKYMEQLMIPWYKQPFNWIIIICLCIMGCIGVLNLGLILLT